MSKGNTYIKDKIIILLKLAVIEYQGRLSTHTLSNNSVTKHKYGYEIECNNNFLTETNKYFEKKFQSKKFLVLL